MKKPNNHIMDSDNNLRNFDVNLKKPFPKFKILRSRCQLCELCVRICPDGFQRKWYGIKIIGRKKCQLSSYKQCPVHAIIFKN